VPGKSLFIFIFVMIIPYQPFLPFDNYVWQYKYVTFDITELISSNTQISIFRCIFSRMLLQIS
jgi:hypothetical protein